jgi:Spy/CpxP family protein refolding chaperone
MMDGRGGGYGAGRVFAELDLTPDQQEKIAKVQEDMRRSNWDTIGQLHAEQFKLRGLYLADKPDPDAIADQQKKVDELHRSMIKAQVETGNRIEALLTKEQRERLREYSPWWMQDGDD